MEIGLETILVNLLSPILALIANIFGIIAPPLLKVVFAISVETSKKIIAALLFAVVISITYVGFTILMSEFNEYHTILIIVPLISYMITFGAFFVYYQDAHEFITNKLLYKGLRDKRTELTGKKTEYKAYIDLLKGLIKKDLCDKNALWSEIPNTTNLPTDYENFHGECLLKARVEFTRQLERVFAQNITQIMNAAKFEIEEIHLNMISRAEDVDAKERIKLISLNDKILRINQQNDNPLHHWLTNEKIEELRRICFPND